MSADVGITQCYFVFTDTGADSSAIQSSQGQSGDATEKGEKPLKLVFKIGPQESSETFTSTQTEERAKHKHKKKKKKKEGKDREREEVGRGMRRLLETTTFEHFHALQLHDYGFWRCIL